LLSYGDWGAGISYYNQTSMSGYLKNEFTLERAGCTSTPAPALGKREARKTAFAGQQLEPARFRRACRA